MPVQVSNTNLVEAYNEMMKCFLGNIYSLNNHTYANCLTFGNNGIVAGDKLINGCFSMAQDFQSFGTNGSFESGLNTSALASNIILSCNLVGENGINYNLYSYCRKQAIYIIDGTGNIRVSV
jgi:hypothetical protein